MKEALREFPQECALLAIQFEETSRYSAEQAEKQRKEAERQRTKSSSAESGWAVEDEVGADDDIDYYDALQRGLIKDDSTWPKA